MPAFTLACNGTIRKERRWLALATLCIAVLIAQLDTSVVNLAVRPIGQYFKASVGALQWIIDSYNFVYAVFLLTGGLLADLYGRRRLFMAGAAVFTLASVLCALSPAVPILIAARALAGFGAALLLPASLAIIRVGWPEQAERGKVLGLWAGCNGIAFAIGPTLGGQLIGEFGWRSIFLLAIPPGLIALILALRYIPESSAPHGRRFDLAGQALGALMLGGLAVAAIESDRLPGLAVTALAAAALALALFIQVEAKMGTAALIPLDIFRIRMFRGAMTATTGMTFGMYGVLFLLPLVWQNAGILDPVGAGIALLPMALVFIAVSSFSGALNRAHGIRFMTSSGVAIIGSGLILIGATAHSASIAGTEIGLTITGLGMGLATGPLMGAAVGAVSARRSGSAAALINVARMIGATLGVATLGAAFAAADNDLQGLRLAMFLGGSVQLIAAAIAWRTIRAANAPAAGPTTSPRI